LRAEQATSSARASACVGAESGNAREGIDAANRLIIHPVALRNRLPLFKDLATPLRLDLAEARSFPGRTVIHVYRPIRATE
jgi:hypothetical protein